MNHFPNIDKLVTKVGLAKSLEKKYKEFKNNSAIICNTPGGWKSGTKANILITFQCYLNINLIFVLYNGQKT